MKRSVFGTVCYYIYLLMGLVYGAAVFAGIDDWWGWPWWLALPISIPISYMPIVGPIVAVMGAIESFDWSPLLAVSLFCWPYLLFGMLALTEGVAACVDAVTLPFRSSRNQSALVYSSPPPTKGPPMTDRTSPQPAPRTGIQGIVPPATPPDLSSEVSRLTHELARAREVKDRECATLRTQCEALQREAGVQKHARQLAEARLAQLTNRTITRQRRSQAIRRFASTFILRPVVTILRSSARLTEKVRTEIVKWLRFGLADNYERALVTSLLVFFLILAVFLCGLLAPRAALITVTCLLVAASAIHSILSGASTSTESSPSDTGVRGGPSTHQHQTTAGLCHTANSDETRGVGANGKSSGL